jgi:uncharacterized membrane protein
LNQDSKREKGETRKHAAPEATSVPALEEASTEYDSAIPSEPSVQESTLGGPLPPGAHAETPEPPHTEPDEPSEATETEEVTTESEPIPFEGRGRDSDEWAAIEAEHPAVAEQFQEAMARVTDELLEATERFMQGEISESDYQAAQSIYVEDTRLARETFGSDTGINLSDPEPAEVMSDMAESIVIAAESVAEQDTLVDETESPVASEEFYQAFENRLGEERDELMDATERFLQGEISESDYQAAQTEYLFDVSRWRDLFENVTGTSAPGAEPDEVIADMAEAVASTAESIGTEPPEEGEESEPEATEVPLTEPDETPESLEAPETADTTELGEQAPTEEWASLEVQHPEIYSQYLDTLAAADEGLREAAERFRSGEMSEDDFREIQIEYDQQIEIANTDLERATGISTGSAEAPPQVPTELAETGEEASTDQPAEPPETPTPEQPEIAEITIRYGPEDDPTSERRTIVGPRDHIDALRTAIQAAADATWQEIVDASRQTGEASTDETAEPPETPTTEPDELPEAPETEEEAEPPEEGEESEPEATEVPLTEPDETPESLESGRGGGGTEEQVESPESSLGTQKIKGGGSDAEPARG